MPFVTLSGASRRRRSRATASCHTWSSRWVGFTDFREHVKLLFDLQALAFQSDLTRVFTFMLGREGTRRSYPEIGIPDAHHPLTHTYDPEPVRKVIKINTYHMTCLRTSWRSCTRSRTVTARCWIILPSCTAPASMMAMPTPMRIFRSW